MLVMSSAMPMVAVMLFMAMFFTDMLFMLLMPDNALFVPNLFTMSNVLAVMRNIFIPVPIILDKIDGTPTCMIFTAVPRPVPFIARRHAQIDGLSNILDLPLDNDGFRVDHLRRPGNAAYVDLAEKTRFANVNRYADISGRRGGCQGEQTCCNNESFHDGLFSSNESLYGVGWISACKLAALTRFQGF